MSPRAREAAAVRRSIDADVEHLSDQRLLDHLAGRGRVGDRIRKLLDADGLLALADHDVADLIELGATTAAATAIATAFELVRRVARARRGHRPELRTAEQVARAVGVELSMMRCEVLLCLPLDAHARLIGQPRVVSRGDVDGTDAGPRLFCRCALAAGATSCIAVHNHPTGDATPSISDQLVTRRLAAAGRTIDVPLVDHVVTGDGERFSSMRQLDPSLFR